MRGWAFPLLSTALFASFLSSVFLGSVRVPPSDVLMYLLGWRGEVHVFDVVVDMRLVRGVAAVLTGASLGVAGAVLQSLFRNPLADPFVLGISSGSSLAIALTLVAGLGAGLIQAYDPYALYMAAAAGAALTSLAVVIFSTIAKTAIGLILAGVMLGYLNAGLTTLLVTLSPVETMRAFSFWTLGTFSAAKWSLVEPVLPLFAVGLVASLLVAKPLNALAFGEEVAASMGAWVRGARVAAVAASSAVVALATVVAGPIGFIGLAAPHVARLLAKSVDNRVVIPLSGLAGATLSITADIAARNIMPPLDLPLTAITSLFGAPIILLLLLRGGKWG